MQHRASDQYLRTASTPLTTPANVSRLSIHAFVPPATDARATLQRVDDVNTVLRMLGEAQTSTVALTGAGGAGKSTLAALVHRRLQTAGIATGAAVAAQPAFSQFVWLSLGPNATLPDCLAALISTINTGSLPTDFFLLKADQQIALLFYALSRAQGGVFVVLDQFEELLNAETSGHNSSDPTTSESGTIALLLAMLQQDLGSSRVIFTCSRSPYSAQNDAGTARPFLPGVACKHARRRGLTPTTGSSGKRARVIARMATLRYLRSCTVLRLIRAQWLLVGLLAQLARLPVSVEW